MVTRKNKAQQYRELMEAASAYIIEEKPRAESPQDVAKLIGPLVQDATQENFFVLLLNTKHVVIEIVTVTVGLVDRTQIHPREVFRTAISKNASRIILAHNHPSGDPTPSAHDIESTKQLVSAGKIIGIDVLDHIVLGKKTYDSQKSYVSFREEHLLSHS